MSSQAIVKLTAQRAAKVEFLDLLAKRAEEGQRVFTAEEKAEFDATKAAVEAIDAQIAAHREIEDFQKSQALPVQSHSFGSLPRSKQNREKGILAGEFIDMLAPLTVLGRMPVRRLSFDDAPSIRIPGQATGVSGAYIGEGGQIAVETVTTREVVLTPKKLATIVPATAEILRRSTPALEIIVRDDMLAGTAQTIDAQFLHGTAVAGVKDAGLLTQATTDSNTAASAGATLANIVTDMKKAVQSMRANKIPMTAPVWVMSAEDAEALRWLTDGLSNFVFRSEIDAGRLSGYPLVTSQTVPTNLGASTKESRVYLVDAAQVFFAEDLAPQIAMSDSATLKLDSDPTNSTAFTSLFQTDSVAFRLITGHSWGFRHAKAVYVVTAVNYAGR